MPKKSDRHTELLKQILANVDLSELPESIREQAQEATADLGGCAFCGRAATRLCDYYLGSEIDQMHTAYPVYLSDGECFTCDAPLCEKCGSEVGMTTVWGGPQAIDYCPHHAKLGIETARPMTKHEAERLRIEAWKRTLFADTM